MSKKELNQLYLSKNERIGVLILFILLLALIIMPWLYYESDLIVTKSEITIPAINSRSEIDMNTNDNSIQNKPEVKYQNHIELNSKTELFEFDPNHLKANDAKRLGIHEKSYRALQNYLATGAKINSPKQFSKIYGIDEILFNKIEPFIKIKDAKESIKLQKESNTKSQYLINLNNAKPEDLVPLPGIGEKLAVRIIKYRNILGGFTNKSQLTEIYGLQDSIIQKFQSKISVSGDVKKIKFNAYDYEALKSHPYIGPSKARVICEYRKQHPALENIKDLYKIEALDSIWINRISEYLSFDQ